MQSVIPSMVLNREGGTSRAGQPSALFQISNHLKYPKYLPGRLIIQLA